MKEHIHNHNHKHFAKITKIQQTNILLNGGNITYCNTLARMVVAISEKRCDCYAYLCKAEYKMRPKGPIYNNNEGENPKSLKHNPKRCTIIKFAAPRW